MKNQNRFLRQTAAVLTACGLVVSLLPGFAAEPAGPESSRGLPIYRISPSEEVPSRYTNDWREEPGLWGSNPEMRNQSWTLAAAGLDSVLGKINTTKVLQNLRTSQEKSGDNRGCFWWRWKARTPNQAHRPARESRKQRFILERFGRVMIDVTGGMDVENRPEYKSWNGFSGFGEGPVDVSPHESAKGHGMEEEV